MKVGLITYHSAYNFGSVMQAYATQEVLRSIAGNCEVINYRTAEQKRVYAIFKWEKGAKFIKSLVKNILIIPTYRNRVERAKKYEIIIEKLFDLSKEVIEPQDVYSMWGKYDLIVSGSDQIWNKHSNELENVSWDYMKPYLLSGYKGKKVSYASSLTNMSDDEIAYILPDIKTFNYISFREEKTAKKLRDEFGVENSSVLDPTFLLTKEEWVRKLSLKHEESNDYILFYVLSRRSEIKHMMSVVKEIGKKTGKKVKMISPLATSSSGHGVEVLEEVDPIDFMNLIYNASMVVTDSYHGTILSVNLGKDVYSVCKGFPSDFRKIDVLNRLGMSARIISNPEELLAKEYEPIDYMVVNDKIESLRSESLNYLVKALRS